MYVESIELIRELVNNAYDADATEVYVTVTPESIVIEDNGSGMNEKGLAQFFTVGSEEKRIHSVLHVLAEKGLVSLALANLLLWLRLIVSLWRVEKVIGFTQLFLTAKNGRKAKVGNCRFPASQPRPCITKEQK